MNNQTENNIGSPARFSSLIKRFRPLWTVLILIALSPLTALGYYQISSSTFDPLRSIIGSYRNYVEIEGSITDGIYTPPLKNFSCRFPSLETGPKGNVLQDHFWTDGSGVVVFTDDFGTLLRADYWEVNDSTTRLLENPETQKSQFEEKLSKLIQESFLPSQPNTIISHTEFLERENGAMLYGVIDTGRTSDALTGVFYLSKGKFLYRLMFADAFRFSSGNDSNGIEELRQGLLDFYHTCEFK